MGNANKICGLKKSDKSDVFNYSNQDTNPHTRNNNHPVQSNPHSDKRYDYDHYYIQDDPHPLSNVQYVNKSNHYNQFHHQSNHLNQTSCISIYDFTISPSETVNTRFISFNEYNSNSVQDTLLNKINYYYGDKQEELVNIISNDKYLKLLYYNEPYKLVNYVINNKDLINYNKKGVNIVSILLLGGQIYLVDQMINNQCDLFMCDQLMQYNGIYFLFECKHMDIRLFNRLSNLEFLTIFENFFQYKNGLGQTYLFPVVKQDFYLYVLKHLVENSNGFNLYKFKNYLIDCDTYGYNCIHYIFMYDCIDMLKYINSIIPDLEEMYLSYDFKTNNELCLDTYSIIIIHRSKKILRYLESKNKLNKIIKNHVILESKVSYYHMILEYYEYEIFSIIIQKLISNKADLENLNIITKSGKTPLFFAATYGHVYFIDYISNLMHDTGMMEMEINNLDMFQATDYRGFSPLHSAVYNNRFEFAERLLKEGVDSNLKNYEHITPLHLAVMNKNINIVKLLIKYRADPLMKNSYGESSFKLACGDDELLGCLFKKK
eukprot:Mrub_02361.p1 GENE.Mrub_02361~~Mrub_02361.p1  ORF type:complete len:546 (-),score=71.55 Mrub_02361:76-1713(-)